MKNVLALGVVATLMVAGLALAHTTVDLSAADAGTFYVPTEDGDQGIWEESNGLDGLQQSETEQEDGTIVPPDTRLDA